MATTTVQTTELRDTGKTVASRIGAGFGAVMRFLCALSNARSCALEVERLTALSDQQLARRGLKRDEIVRHVFRNQMYE